MVELTLLFVKANPIAFVACACGILWRSMATELTAMSLNGGSNMSVKQPLLNGAADENQDKNVLAGADAGIEEDIAMAKRQEESKGYTDAEAAAAL